MNELNSGLIVSCQAEEGSPFNHPQFIAAFAQAAAQGGAVGVRVRDPENVKAVSKVVDLPVIGLTKGEYETGAVLITPTLDDVSRLADAGADMIAVDATARRRPNGMTGIEFLQLVKSKVSSLIVADISNWQEGIAAVEEGADLVATTLSGYTEGDIRPNVGPDYQLIEDIASRTEALIIAEGRIWSPEQAVKAIRCGAFAVCVGSAITRPVEIAKRFADSIGKRCDQSEAR